MRTTFGPARRWASVWALAAALTASLTGTAAQAALLHSQGYADGNDAFQSISTAQNADSFQFGYGVAINSISFYGTWADTATLTVRLFEGDLTATPDGFTQLTGTLSRSAPQFQANVDGFLFDAYEYTLNLDSAYTTAANQLYYVSIFSSVDWGWVASTEGDGRSAYRGGDGSSWNFSEPDLAFSVSGDRLAVNETPEPVSLALLAVAAAAAVVARRRPA